MPSIPKKRSAAHRNAPNKRSQLGKGSASQPINVDASQLRIRTSPRKALTIAASQATDTHPFESQLRDMIPEGAIALPTEGSGAATEAETIEIPGDDDDDDDNDDSELQGFDSQFADNFDSIDWGRLKQYCKPVRTLKNKKSWVYDYGYRVALRSDMSRIFWVCKICHVAKSTRANPIVETTSSTSGALRHLRKDLPGHRRNANGFIRVVPDQGQQSIKFAAGTGLHLSQGAANTLGNFDIQGFRYAAVSWLIDNNHPLREFETPAFREMIAYANPEAAEALWVSHASVSSYVMRLYRYMEPQVAKAISRAASKVHISFDGWTIKGGKRGFFGIVAHFADANGILRDLPIALPQLSGAHTGARIADIVAQTLETFGIHSQNLGCFILDNASANNTAVAELASRYSFNALHCRLRCAPHTLNLVGQMIIFGHNKDAYNNSDKELLTEAQFLQEWRRQGPLGTLIDIINYITTPQQHELFADAQRAVNAFPHAQRDRYMEPVKPVVTRWNSYHDTFERAILLKDAVDKYANDHIERQDHEDVYARSKGNRLADAPSWMRTNGLTAADWAVITEYVEVLQPLKEACQSLEARGRSGKFGAIYEVIPQFEAILKAYESILEPYEDVDFNAFGAPEDHIAINLRAAWQKLDKYYNKLDESPMYYAACCLHPYYKNYCSNSWRDKPDWIYQNEAALQQLWGSYKPAIPQPKRSSAPRTSSLRDSIAALVNAEPNNKDSSDIVVMDQLDRWRRFEPAWTSSQFESNGNPVSYWTMLRHKYPELAQLAVDILSIPASSCDCKRLFSELGDLLEPRRRKIGSQMLAAIQCLKSWRASGYRPPNRAEYDISLAALSEEEVITLYDINAWE
jgi:hypothetical protein